MVLIFAYGNSLRRDDGAGFALGDVVERMLREAGLQVRRIDSHQLEPEFALDISDDEISAVLFIDTRAITDPAGDDLNVHISPIVPAEDASPSVGHHFDPSTLLVYSRYLFDREPPAWLISVPGKDFDHGEGLSETALEAIRLAPETIDGLIPLLKPA
jgi:hydrogenase maturation protease